MTIYRQNFDQMTEDEKQQVYRRHHIHVSGKRPAQEALFGIDSWNSKAIQAIVDYSALRQCHGKFCMLFISSFTQLSATDNTFIVETPNDVGKDIGCTTLMEFMKKREAMLKRREECIHRHTEENQRSGRWKLPPGSPAQT